MPLSDQVTAAGQSAQNLVDYIDNQQSRLQEIQKVDLAQLATTPEGPARQLLSDNITERTRQMDQNEAFKSRLNNGEHPASVQLNMVERDALVLIANGGSSAGREAFELIENGPLTAEQKQQAFCTVVQDVVASGCKNAREGEGALRANTPGTQFMSSFMKEYASDYIAAVSHQTLEAIKNIKLPEAGISQDGKPAPLNHENTPKVGFRNDPDGTISPKTMSAADLDSWDQVYFQAGMAAVNAYETQLPLLSPEAQKFLETCGNTARSTLPGEQGENAAVMIMANTVGLRGAFHSTGSDGGFLNVAGTTSLDQTHGRILTGASTVGQSYANLLMREMPVGTPKAQNIIVAQLREQEGVMMQSRATMQNLSRGILPNTPQQELAPANSNQIMNQIIPGREHAFATGHGPLPVVLPVPSAASEGLGQQGPSKRSVRDMLRGAADRISSAAGDLKATITDKVDQVKLERLEKQLDKRQTHLDRLKKDMEVMGDLDKREDRDKRLAKLQSQYDPVGGDPAAQMKIADKIDAIKAANKLEDRITRNQATVYRLKTKVQAQEDKIKLRADRKKNAQDQAGPAMAV
jgi:hypothetical protein